MRNCKARTWLGILGATVALACDDSITAVEAPVPPAPAAPAAFNTVGAPNTISSWVGGESFTLDTVANRLYRSNGEILVLNAEQALMTLTMMRSLAVTDRDLEALEVAYYERDGKCIIDNSCVEPMFVPETPTEASREEVGPVIIVRDTAPASFPGRSEGRRFPLREPPRKQPSRTEVAAMSSTDLCYDTVDRAVFQAERYRSSRGGFLREIFGAGVAMSSGMAFEKFIPNASATAFYDIIARHSFEHIQINALAWLWYAQGCNSRQYFIDHIADEREPIAGPLLGGESRPTDYMWQCNWEVWRISIDRGGSYQPVNVRVCGYYYVK